MLFLYKKFTFNFDELKQNTTTILNSFSYGEEYIINTDTFKDLAVGDSIYLIKQQGGQNKYFSKYLKYKTKYLKIKNKN